MTIAHALSVDVEDWFQVLNMAHVVDRSTWQQHELRCGDATRRLLELRIRLTTQNHVSDRLRDARIPILRRASSRACEREKGQQEK